MLPLLYLHMYDFRIIPLNSSVSAPHSLIFVDKNAGVPVSATVDNIGENMIHQVQLLLPKRSPPLHLASRLDVCTSGESTFDSVNEAV